MNIRPSIAVLFALPVVTLALSFAAPQEKKAALAAGTYEIDSVHSTVGFKIKHLNTSWAFGRFDEIHGSITVDPAKPEASKVEVTVQTETVDTKIKKRDDHLRSPDFFDVKQFPTITFKSKSVQKKGDNVYAVTGDLTLHGVTKSVTVDMENTGAIDSPQMGKLAGFYGTITVKRSDYGMNFMPDALSDEVQVVMSFEGGLGKAK
jgi:polyisoprenoid-binding protein YceI